MRHFEFLPENDTAKMFAVPPWDFGPTSEGTVLADVLGATLYSPATRVHMAEDLVQARSRGLVSSVACLEDAIAESEVQAACEHLIGQLARLSEMQAGSPGSIPLVFVRVRTSEQMVRIARELAPTPGGGAALTGYVLPKFATTNAKEYFAANLEASELLGRRLWLMPVIETPEVIRLETRQAELFGISEALHAERDQVLAVRTGGTDLAAAYGLRRPKELTVYDVNVVAHVLADVVNILGHPDGFVVTGPVWEYYSDSERLFKPQLRRTPFHELDERSMRAELITAELDGLIREVVLDRANGLFGKTVIHPSHVAVVHALSVVSLEDYSDASAVLGEGHTDGGVFGSAYRNKMNEVNPHRAWAERTIRRARAFGVANDGVSFVDLLAAVARV